jgi:2-dehydro-3-deoxyphosphogluconate aldolase/(4S)-4-hydroxy-2-oxoglutarate aldolase
VTDAAQAAAAAQAGARFAVAPGLSEPVVAAAREIGLPFFPGVATPTEIGRAADLGCRVLKVFPASSLGGPAYLRSVSAPYPGLRFIPTGGISASTIGQYLELPAVIACGGSWLCDEALAAAGRFDEIRRRASAARRGAP